jgi:hypothetical protein
MKFFFFFVGLKLAKILENGDLSCLRPKFWKMKKTLKCKNMNRAKPMWGIPLYIKNNSFMVGALVRERESEIEGGFGEEGARAQDETQ